MKILENWSEKVVDKEQAEQRYTYINNKYSISIQYNPKFN